MFDVVNAAFENGGSITRDMRSLVKNAVENAYFEGLAEGGISPDEMDEEDAQNIVQLDLTQQSFIPAFSADVRKAARDGTTEAKNAIIGRIDLWTASIAAAGQAGLNSAKRNEMVTWHLGATEEHCSTCANLDGQAHRRKWFDSKNYIPRKPGAAMDCGGWRCLCTLEA